MDGRTEGRTDGRTDGQRDRQKSGLWRCMNVLKLAVTPFKKLRDRQTDRWTDQLTNKKVAYRGL